MESISIEGSDRGFCVAHSQMGPTQEELAWEMYYQQFACFPGTQAQPYVFWSFPTGDAAAVGTPFSQQQLVASLFTLGTDAVFTEGGRQCYTSEPADCAPKQRALEPAEPCRSGEGQASTPLKQRAEDEMVAEQLLLLLEEGGEALVEARAILEKPGTVRRLSFQAKGCRAVQKALEELDRHTAASLARGLEGSVRQAARSPFANYVVQEIIKGLGTDEVAFVLAELGSCAAELAYHEYGCRIFCRLLEHHMEDERTACLVDVVLQQAAWLVRDKFGCHVMETVLERGVPYQKQAIVHVLRPMLLSNAQDKYASFVVTKALEFWECGGALLAQDLLCHPPKDLAATFSKSTGGMVGRALLRQGGEDFIQSLAERLQAPEAQWRLQVSNRGKRFWGLLRRQLEHDRADFS